MPAGHSGRSASSWYGEMGGDVMPTSTMIRARRTASLAVFLGLACAIACSSPPPPLSITVTKCGLMDIPCGDGCIPAGSNVTCCAQTQGPSATTSSYCVSGTCYDNSDGRCNLNGTPTQFCCTPAGSIGSNDCPAGTHHCGVATPGGTGCVADGQLCCDESKGQTCNDTTIYSSLCDNGGTVDCGYCSATGMCISCPSGYCCAGDPCNGGSCAPGDCTAPGGGSSSGSSGSSGSSSGGCPSTCSTNGDCAGFAMRNCPTPDGAPWADPYGGVRCASDGQCHCCDGICSAPAGGGPATSCTCLDCSSCPDLCSASTCVNTMGGTPCQ
jgi:hypothetical protein